MPEIADPNNPDAKAGESIHGYRLRQVAYLEDNRTWYYELQHERTGARHIHLSRADEENVFAVAFKTVPRDSTGVAHILEHTVLCGSETYPVRDPFFSMLRRSLSTFMNAFTASDWTMYPFATQNRKDFYNLMDVYLDAVFFPKLDELSFKQEGHRLEFEGGAARADAQDFRLVYKGVVYNEMKGAMSSPDQVMVRSILKALYPDTTYSNNSGGDPAVIPSLSHAQLVAFHRGHYHPSNAFFYTYGNMPLAAHLARIDAGTMNRFECIDPKTEVPPQQRWLKPRSATFAYPLDSAADPSQKAQMCVAWLASDVRDHFEVLTLALLEQILLANAASPMRNALMASGLGSALCDGCGFDAENRDTLFVVGLKDVAEASVGRIEALIFEVLRRLCEEGIDPDLVAAAFHQIEFHRREITNSPYPYGIKLLMSFAGAWFHGAEPLRLLNLDEDLNRLRQEIGSGPLLENAIRRYFLENSHCVRLTLVPDLQMGQNEEQRVRRELEQLKRELTAEDLRRIEEDTARLRQLQDEIEDVECLPTLEREDIPTSVAVIRASGAEASLPVTYFDQGTSGISYLAAAAGAEVLPADLVPLASFYGYAFSRTGTRRSDYVEMARRIDGFTGGIGLAAQARTRFDAAGACVPFIAVNAKCLDRNLGAMFGIVQELLFEHDFGDLARLKTLLLEYRAALETAVIHNGHRLAISLAARNFSDARALTEIWGGISQLVHIKQVSADLSDPRLRRLAEMLETFGGRLLTRNNARMAFIGEAEAITAARPMLQDVCRRLADASGDGAATSGGPKTAGIVREGWITSTAVSFVAQTFETVRMAHPDAPALAVIAKLLRSGVLHREIREKGGAYGGFALYNPEDGVFCLASYRDPHIVRTLDVCTTAADRLVDQGFSDEDVKEAILQVCAEIDKPDPPGPAARKAFYRAIIGLSDEQRKEYKRRLLALDRRQVLAALDAQLRKPDIARSVAVISNEENLAAANDRIDGPPLVLKRI